MKKLLITLLMVMFLSLNFNGQVQVDSLESLPDGTYIVGISGMKFRALPPDKIRQILLDRQELIDSRELLKEKDRQFEQYKILQENKLSEVQRLDKLELDKVTKEAKFWEGEYTKEQKLRLKFQNIVDGCSGKIIFVRFCI